MAKFSIILPYINRWIQFRETLKSFKQYGDDLYEIILVIDSKCKFIEHDLAQRNLRSQDKAYTLQNKAYNPTLLYNYGVSKASGEYVVISNPECLHETSVLNIFDNLSQKHPDSYYVASCKFERPKDSQGWIWRQHSEQCSTKYHFCSCLKTETYKTIGGFDERFADGYCFDDDAFRDKMLLNDIPIIEADEAIVRHQRHSKPKMPHKGPLWLKNKKLWEAEYRDKLIKLKKNITNTGEQH